MFIIQSAKGSRSIQNISKLILRARETTLVLTVCFHTVGVKYLSFCTINQHKGKGEDKLCLCDFMPD